jgi:RNA polymerase sigma factor (sigma-70 family)
MPVLVENPHSALPPSDPRNLTMIDTPESSRESGPTDDELLRRAREGSSDAFAALWRRHAGVAYTVARTFHTLDADDIVSEAFTRVLEAIRSGKGPSTAFRPYLTMAVKNVGRYHYNRGPSLAEREREATREVAAPSGEDVAIASYERDATAAAFLSLPERWQEVLWYSEVDGLKPRVISEYIGIPANAVSALAVRAKRGLRDAWVTVQLARARTPECGEALADMSAYSRGALAERARARVEGHLATCPTCPSALKEAQSLANLTLALLPVFAGGVGAAAYSAFEKAPPMPEALRTDEEDDDSSDAAAAAVVAASPSRKRPLVAAVWVAGAVIVVGGIAGALILPGMGEPPHVDGSPFVSPTSAPSPTPTPSPTPQLTPGATPTPAPTAPAEDPSPPTRGGNDPGSPEPGDGAEAAPSPGAPGGAPSEPAPGRPLAAPVATLQQTDARLYPVVRGSSATPGATIEVLDEGGSVVGQTTAGRSGAWSARVVSGDVGTHELAARQVVRGDRSPLSAPMSYTTTASPTILSPAPGQSVDAAEFVFAYSAAPGVAIQRQIVGITALQTLVTPASGNWREYFAAPAGTHTVTVRYIDPQTGDYGPANEYTFTAR